MMAGKTRLYRLILASSLHECGCHAATEISAEKSNARFQITAFTKKSPKPRPVADVEYVRQSDII